MCGEGDLFESMRLRLALDGWAEFVVWTKGRKHTWRVGLHRGRKLWGTRYVSERQETQCNLSQGHMVGSHWRWDGKVFQLELKGISKPAKRIVLCREDGGFLRLPVRVGAWVTLVGVHGGQSKTCCWPSAQNSTLSAPYVIWSKNKSVKLV